MTTQVSSPTAQEDPLWSFVTAARSAFVASDSIAEDKWSDDKDDLVQGVSIKRCTTDIISEEGPITVAIVTQLVGVVIPPHRHHESHVLLKVTKGTIWVDCEGYSRRIEKDHECLIPEGFCHSVFALECKDGKAASYLSAHYKEFLNLDDNRFLAKWPEKKKTDASPAKMTELEVVRERMSWFLSLQPEYLEETMHDKYRAWFYLLHFDEDQSLQAVAETGHAGCWKSHMDNLKLIMDYQPKEDEFRVGKDLSHSGWYQNGGRYVPLFVAHEEKSNASKITDYYAYKDSSTKEWAIHRPDGVTVEPSESADKGFSQISFLRYMKLLTKEFLPGTEYIIYMTPPQQPGKSGSVEECQRRPFSSCVVGMTHGTPEFLCSLFTYFLLCSSVLQQIRFAVRSDVNRIRHNEDRRRAFFEEELLTALRKIP